MTTVKNTSGNGECAYFRLMRHRPRPVLSTVVKRYTFQRMSIPENSFENGWEHVILNIV